ncbi:methyltransferase family protein [Hydrogenivirga caldilitoris]|uniref:Methyltransferase family protein n=1 Tax=Hydrogenivirga caldilitoris TaxID=246264 RepID=A0A497XRB0_9AQUI|nr:class I SAM-dependent methyltransferase [Hydrogenivirga caldilitoris]RLJ70804.1 methyltransferase family protein [Hydrogenivirga caldilitoris]
MSLFEGVSLRYDQWYEKPFGRSAFELELSCLKRLVGNFRRGLEVGVGTGRFASALGVEFGLDPSFDMLKLARKRGIKCVQGVGEELPFRDRSFDLVLIVVSICFVEEPLRVLKESKRVLNEGGKLILGLIPKESLWAEFYTKKGIEGHPIYRHAKFYSLKDIEVMLSESGFAIGSVTSTLLEEPQDERPISNKAIVKGFARNAGFSCISATLTPL